MKKPVIFSIFTLVASLLMVSCAGGGNVDVDPDNPSGEEEYNDPEELSIPVESFHTREQTAYLTDNWDSISNYASGTEELSRPYGNVFNYENKSAKYLQISSESDYETYRLFDIEGLDRARIYNLYSDTNYYWRTFASKDFTVTPIEQGTLRTDNVLPRNCYIESLDSSHYVTNVRDLGGYESSLGGKVKQGLMYRGGRLSGGETIEYIYDGQGQVSSTKTHKAGVCYSTVGYKQLTETLGVTNEIDLRMAEKTQTMGDITLDDGSKKRVVVNEYIENGNRADNPNIIPNMNVHTISINSSETAFMSGADGKNDGKEYIKEFFRICAEPTNYPMYIHCYIGTDRTGCLCYLANAVLGVSSEALVRDYLFSNFGNIGGSRDPYAIRSIYEPILNRFNKPSLAENAEAYLLSIGVTQTQIDSIRNIMLAH